MDVSIAEWVGLGLGAWTFGVSTRHSTFPPTATLISAEHTSERALPRHISLMGEEKNMTQRVISLRYCR